MVLCVFGEMSRLLIWLKKYKNLMYLYLCLVFFGQNAGEESVANIDKLRHANGSQTTADIRLKMQKVENQ